MPDVDAIGFFGTSFSEMFQILQLLRCKISSLLVESVREGEEIVRICAIDEFIQEFLLVFREEEALQSRDITWHCAWISNIFNAYFSSVSYVSINFIILTNYFP